MGLALPTMKANRQVIGRYQALVVSGLVHAAYDAAAGRDQITKILISANTSEEPIALLEDSGKFLLLGHDDCSRYPDTDEARLAA